MDYEYTPIKKERDKKTEKFYWKFVIRQTLICIAPWISFFIGGLYLGTPTVMIPQLRKEANSTAIVSDEMASWMSSIHFYSTIPYTITVPILSEIYGRKIPFIMASTIATISYVLWFFSTTVMSIFIAEIICGVILGIGATLSVVIISEYSSPKYRGVFLTINSATFFWGILVANVTGTFWHWRNIMIIALVCLSYNITVFIWPQSPLWLATKGRYEECAASHRWLRGTSEEAEKDLKQLITSQKKYLSDLQPRTKISPFKHLTNFFKIFADKVVYKPVLLSIVLFVLYDFSGKLVCSVYAIQILQKLTNRESTAYMGMLILDCVSLLGMYLGCYLARILKRRIMLFTTSSCSALCMLTLSLYLYLIKLNYVRDNTIVILSLLTIFSISIGCGPMLLSNSIFAELIPSRHKASILISIIIIANITGSTMLKVAPSIFKAAGLHGAFLFYGLSVTICLIILYLYLPETKGKTLIEIEEYFKN